MSADSARRDLARLPKAHLHLHFTGSMRHSTLLDLAGRHRLHLPDALLRDPREHPPHLDAARERGWFRFQRLYDAARAVLVTEDDVRRLLHEVAADEQSEGSGWLEIQIDPSGYAARFGGLTPALELALDAAREAAVATGLGIGVVVAANRTKHPLDARTLARLAARYSDAGVVGFGLSNDERRGRTGDFTAAFRIARSAGLSAVPHAGELLGPESIRTALESLGATRIGHGVRSVEDPAVLELVAACDVALEVSPWSNVSLGVYDSPTEVPLRRLVDAGVRVALAADDPLISGRRLNDQYSFARDHLGFTDVELAHLARSSIAASHAPEALRRRLRTGVDDWLASG
ncbi:MAG: adenosine deaminase [Candidatus Nanopelagicales bacterium]